MWRAGSVLLAVGSMTCVLAAGAAGAAATTGGSTVPVAVKPGIGSRSTHFTVSFRAPQTTGSTGTGGPRYEVSASGPSGRRCASKTSTAVGPARSGQRVQVRLGPPGPSHVWCRGRYTGKVMEVLTPRCPPREACPLFIAVMDIGRFSFGVR
jgi:hypothetical protein